LNVTRRSTSSSGSMQTIIERAGHADIPALVELMSQFYAESSYALDREWAAASFAQLLEDELRGAVWIARCGTDPAGHVVLALRHSMEFGGLAGVVDDLFVRPQFRRNGVGSALLSALFDACRKLHVAAFMSRSPRTTSQRRRCTRHSGSAATAQSAKP